MPEPDRFVDTRETLHDFTAEVLVACPACGRCTRVLPRDPQRAGLFGPRRMACGACGVIREWVENGVYLGDDRDPYLGLPLWLAVPCCGETLWAYNRRHLEYLESFVRARLREQMRGPEHGWSNQSLANRLPGWIKDRKNRPELLRAIEKLKARCPS